MRFLPHRILGGFERVSRRGTQKGFYMPAQGIALGTKTIGLGLNGRDIACAIYSQSLSRSFRAYAQRDQFSIT